jgi:uncharacterized membrane protein
MRVNLLHTAVDAGTALLAWVILAPALWLALRAARGRFFPGAFVENAWLGGAVCVALLWLFEVKVGNGPRFGMLGCGLYALVFGRSRGMLGLMLALILHTALNHGAWRNLGLNGVLFAVLPAMIAGTVQQCIELRLPRNLFVFIIGNGMFATLAATVVTSLLLMATALVTGASPPVAVLGDYVGAAMLLAWSESIVSGMLFSALVIFLPAIVLTYQRDRYLPAR